jgi:hypothetical protein
VDDHVPEKAIAREAQTRQARFDGVAAAGRLVVGVASSGRDPPCRGDTGSVPPITELSRIEPAHLARLEKQGIFTTGILLEVSETPTRRQYLADHVKATPNDVATWRDEALMLNLAGFGVREHQLMVQAGIDGLRDILDLSLEDFRLRLARAADQLKTDAPPDLIVQGWWEQARTLEEE